MESKILKYEELAELRKQLEDIGVATESQNRLPMFEPTLKPQYQKRVYEGKYGKLLVEGRLGQAHKNLLEAILWKREAHTYIEIEGKEHLKVAYDREKIRKYLSQSSKYSYAKYKELLKDMIQTYIELETDKVRIKGTLIMKVQESLVKKPTKGKSPIIPEETPLTVVIFGDVATALIDKELRFTYDPKPIMKLDSGISQAIVRFLKTHQSHPQAGYHLKGLVANLIENVEGQKWWDIRRLLKKDAEKLEDLGIAIDFKQDRLYVVDGKVKV
jgi:hypothetical protein